MRTPRRKIIRIYTYMYLHFMCSFVCLVLFFLLFHTVYFNFSELNMRPHITILKLQLMHMYIVFDWLLRTWLKRYIIFNFVIWLFVLVQTWMVKTILRHWWTFFSNIRQLRFVKKTCVICMFLWEFPMWRVHFVYSIYSGGSMSKVISNSSYWPITNTKWVRSQLWKLQKGCTRLTAASDKSLPVACRWSVVLSSFLHH